MDYPTFARYFYCRGALHLSRTAPTIYKGTLVPHSDMLNPHSSPLTLACGILFPYSRLHNVGGLPRTLRTTSVRSYVKLKKSSLKKRTKIFVNRQVESTSGRNCQFTFLISRSFLVSVFVRFEQHNSRKF